MYPTWLLAALPLVLLSPWMRGKTQKSGLIAPHLLALLSDKEATKNKQKQWPLIALVLAWLLSVFALAGPSWQQNEMPAVSLSGARVLVMDMSRSMYATDILPNRLTQARFKALDMLPGWKEGSSGLVAYAGDGYVISPLTDDAQTLKTLIPELSPNIMPSTGSNAAGGIMQAIELLTQAGFTHGDIILITDGMTERESKTTLNTLNSGKYRVSILVIGTQQGAPIQLPDGSLLEQNGKPVIAKVALQSLSVITQKTGGILQIWQPTDRDVENLVTFTKKPMDSTTKNTNQFIEKRLNAGFWLIMPVMLLALFGFRRGAVLTVMFILVPTHSVSAAIFQTNDQQAYSQYISGDFKQAAEGFTSPEWKGIAQYKNGNYPGAIDTLSTLNDMTSRFNLGNAYALSGDLKKAAEAFTFVLQNDPNNADAKKNLNVVQQAIEQQQQDQSSEQQPLVQQQNDQNDSAQDQVQQQEQNSKQLEQKNMSSLSESQTANGAQDQKSEGKSHNINNAKSSNKTNEPVQSFPQHEANPKKESNKNSEQNPNPVGEAPNNSQDSLSTSHSFLNKLEQVHNDTAGLIHAQIILQARQKNKPEPTENSW
ncbi:TPR domain protein in aerotolerance operon [Candidatus Enterovibrio altilux]|uniref:TPR domain protein in aerotolerance operon n=2 Tax=Candidatus Enterovibrio altilux TaxID=1927128 RepID=A0A291BBL8_9GAMM|nr:TPR domain protein in aerotolerance operon [Candidatus Enterovibrio luxaltus]